MKYYGVVFSILVSAFHLDILAQVNKPIAANGMSNAAGSGIHGANSPFAQLQDRADVLSWSVLTAITTQVKNNRVVPIFPAQVQALSQKTLRVQGFMMPLEPGEKQKRFLLSSVPLTCSFCTPGGPESMIEVHAKIAVKYSLEAIVIEGRLTMSSDDPYGMYYRLSDAISVK